MSVTRRGWRSGDLTGFALGLAAMASAQVGFAGTASSAAVDPPPRSDAAQAETAAPQSRPLTKSEDALGLSEVIVTGVAYGTLQKQDASFAISTLDADQIHEYAPKTVADLFSATPGVWVEASGGDTGANVFVRGFAQSSGAQFVTIELNGMPIFQPTSVGFNESSSLFRLDESVERVEALRGGPNPVLGTGQAGATFNFLQKKGGPEAQGLAKVTLTDFGTERVDALYSGPLAEDLYYMVGGFYRTSPGYRDVQYQGDQGGQVEFQITRALTDGELNVYGRKTVDNNTWYLPIPLQAGADGQTPQPFPGFNPYYGTYQGNDTRLATLEISPGNPPGTLKVNAADGRGVDTTILGANLDKEVAPGWSLAAKALFTTGKTHTKGLVGNSPVETLGDFINQTISSANADPTVVAAAGGPATGIQPGSLQYAGSGQAISNLSLPVMTVGWWSVEEGYKSFSVDARISKELFSGNNLTVGTYLNSFSYNSVWYLGSNMLLAAQGNGPRINFNLDNGALATRAGFVGSPFFDRNLVADSRNTAGFLTDSWKISDAFTADAGARVERYTVHGTQEGVSFGVNLDNDPLTLYDNGTAILNGNYSALRYSKTATSWTGGVNWAIAKSFSLFGRVNSGLRFPSFDDVSNAQVLTEKIRQYEIGAKAFLPRVEFFATAFRNTFSNIPYFQIIGSSTVLSSANSAANGVELETVVNPAGGLEISLQGTYQNGHFTSGPNSGNKIFRQPDFEARLAPAYTLALTDQIRARAFASAWYVGHRFSDIQNQQPLQPFVQINAGMSLNIGEHWQVQLSGDNLTNKIGLTERDPRTLGSGVTNGAFLGRPIFGRSGTLSGEYTF